MTHEQIDLRPDSIEEMAGFFYAPSELSPQLQKASLAVGQIDVSDLGEQYRGTYFITEIGGDRYVVTARHIFDPDPLGFMTGRGKVILPTGLELPFEPMDMHNERIIRLGKDILAYRIDDIDVGYGDPLRFSAGGIPDLKFYPTFYPTIMLGYPQEYLERNGFTGPLASVGVNLQHWGQNLIETEARVEEGCSGSPLLNLEGEVIGVLTNKYDRSRTSRDWQGIGMIEYISEREGLSRRISTSHGVAEVVNFKMLRR